MRLDEAKAHLEAHRDDLARHRVRFLALFGSVARGEARPGSDVDVLVEFEGATTFDRFMDLRIFLEDLFGCRVDLFTRKSVRSRLRARIEEEAIRVA